MWKLKKENVKKIILTDVDAFLFIYKYVHYSIA